MRLRVISEFRHGTQPYTEVDFEYDPDMWTQQPQAVAFIYNPDGVLHYDAGKTVHKNLIAQHAEYYGMADRDFDSCSEIVNLGIDAQSDGQQKVANHYFAIAKKIDEFRFGAAQESTLLGRISAPKDGQKIFAFWNDYDVPELVVPCIKTLLREELIGFTDLYAQLDKLMTVRDYLRGGRFEPDEEAEQRKAMRQELHLMSPANKKAAMKELGLVGGGHKQPWQKAAEKQQLVSPGQKWWASTSEGRDRT